MVLAKAPCCGMSEVVAEGGEDASEKPPVMLALPMSETYTGALSHGPGGVLSWARARYTLAHRGRQPPRGTLGDVETQARLRGHLRRGARTFSAAVAAASQSRDSVC